MFTTHALTPTALRPAPRFYPNFRDLSAARPCDETPSCSPGLLSYSAPYQSAFIRVHLWLKNVHSSVPSVSSVFSDDPRFKVAAVPPSAFSVSSC
jgi:hypothetical protein